MLEIGNIEDAIQRIKFADRVFVFARGFSEMIGQEMLVKLQLTGKIVKCILIQKSSKASVGN